MGVPALSGPAVTWRDEGKTVTGLCLLDEPVQRTDVAGAGRPEACAAAALAIGLFWAIGPAKGSHPQPQIVGLFMAD